MYAGIWSAPCWPAGDNMPQPWGDFLSISCFSLSHYPMFQGNWVTLQTACTHFFFNMSPQQAFIPSPILPPCEKRQRSQNKLARKFTLCVQEELYLKLLSFLPARFAPSCLFWFLTSVIDSDCHVTQPWQSNPPKSPYRHTHTNTDT